MKALVTGGGGFLGSAIVRRLRARGFNVVSLSRNQYPELDALGVEQIPGTLSNADDVLRAARGCDVVFHVAAKAGVWGRYADFYATNVVGTQYVLTACRHWGIGQLIYTSSPSVVFDGTDMEGVDESAPYPSEYEAAYPKTKAIAERLVLEASGPSLATVSLRPHLIWGPGDNHLVPRIVARGRAGRLRRIGTENKLIDSIYIDNAVDAHLLALDRLTPTSAVAGKAYFLSQGDPWPLWELVNAILATANVPPVERSIPTWFAKAAGRLLEVGYRVLDLPDEPPMTPFLASELSTAHWFDITAARRDLGYVPHVSIEEGLQRLSPRVLC